jgi:hypothetical protein
MTHAIDPGTIQSLRHVLLQARSPGPGTETDYERAYAFWFAMWRSTFAEVAPDTVLHSDAFLTQREVSVVLQGERVLGLMMYDFRDLRLKAHRDLGYFSHFPADVIETLKSQGHAQVMMTGQLTVHPDFRKTHAGPFMSDLLMGLSVKRFLSSSLSCKLAFTRNDRGVQDLCYRFGALPLRRGHSAYGLPCDLVAFYRDRACEGNLPGLANVVDRLWATTNLTSLFSALPPALNERPAANDVVVVSRREAQHG